MQKYNILFFSLLLFCGACGGDRVPDNIIQPDRMTRLLTEIHITDGSMYNVMQVPDSLFKYGTAKYLMVFKSFHTDSNQFKKSLQYYSQNPELLVKMYEQVSDVLKKKSDSLNKVNQQQIAADAKRKADSIKKLPKQPATQTKPIDTPKIKPRTQPAPIKRFVPFKRKPNADPIK
ncbi:DUF4296 domain-containing protein [Mucilaginibacter ginsenosidivorans]|uniref:DUF4296 domain-containing protein n=1 Tax=Mucilaginibacter ginsenosidivorans TaxID=398053 RepID=A0A5B8UZA3_9SPHI|nr:DUF4296 domain-containing protein [Mucilaginibacter ginsenosidivorans]QEC64085.1 DUF4296 domain-containing protein [Mucilaginibacter ginsenosidivorans]